jgi:AcrR family transcriptional regulator
MVACHKPAPGSSPSVRILLTAHALFYRHGIRATGVDRLIEESGVAKKTFYRYYPTKNDLIAAFLEYRLRIWSEWFEEAVRRRGGDLSAIVPALSEWFNGEEYRGCAFINSIAEVGNTLPAAVDAARRHQRHMVALIRKMLPPSSTAVMDARAVALAIDGAIVAAQFAESADNALSSLDRVIRAVRQLSHHREMS